MRETNRNNVLIIGVIYPGVERFLPDYVASIQKQIHTSFALLILDHGAGEDVRKTLPPETILIEVDKEATTAEVRSAGIDFAISAGYDYLIFSDTDDYFSESRVGASIAGLGKYDFVYNRLQVVTDGAEEVQPEVGGYPAECTGYELILDRNIFGLSNTAAAVKALGDIDIPGELIAVDWWIFTILLLMGYKGGYVKEAVTYYRQSDDNTVGMGRLLTEKRLEVGIKVKRIHYGNVAVFCSKNDLTDEAALFKAKSREIEELEMKLKQKSFRERYIQVINKNFAEIFIGWWSEILPIKEWKNYA